MTSRSPLKVRAASLTAGVLAVLSLMPAGTASAYTTQTENRISTSRMTADKTYQIFTVRPDGTGPVQLTAGGRNKCDPAMSPHGDLVAFSHGTKISLVPTDGSGTELEVAAVPTDEYVRTPAWSPDGKTIVFMRSFGSQGGTATSHTNRIYAVHRTTATSSDWTTPTEYLPAGTQARAPKFSPDGSSLVFSRSASNSADQETDLWVWHLATQTMEQVTSMPGGEGMSSWHPTQPGLLLFTTCSRGVYTVTVGSSAPPSRVGTLSACDVTWESSSGNRILTHSGSTLAVYDVASGRSTAVSRKATDRQPDW